MTCLDLLAAVVSMLATSCGGAAAADPPAPAPHTRHASPRQLDVNGDGFADVVVTELERIVPTDAPTEANVLVYYGGAHGIHDLPDRILGGPRGAAVPGGGSVIDLGDINGDGTSDLLLTERRDGAGGAHGTLFGDVYLGGLNGPSLAPDQQIATPHHDLDHLSFAPAGDINGDGFSDVIAWVSCPDVDYPMLRPDPRECTPDLNAFYIFYGSAWGLVTTPGSHLEHHFTGWQDAVALGDFDGDGFDDVLWGAEVYLGSRTGLSLTPAITLQAPDGAALDIVSSARAGDLDHDGFPDVILAAMRDHDPYDVARYVYRGGAKPASTPAQTLPGRSSGDDLVMCADKARTSDPEFECTPPGDPDGDGVHDLILATADTVLVFPGVAHHRYGTKPVVLTGTHRKRAWPAYFPASIAGSAIR